MMYKCFKGSIFVAWNYIMTCVLIEGNYVVVPDNGIDDAELLVTLESEAIYLNITLKVINT